MKIFNFPKAERELAAIEENARKRRSSLADVKYELPDATRVDAEAGEASKTQTEETGAPAKKEDQKKSRSAKKKA